MVKGSGYFSGSDVIATVRPSLPTLKLLTAVVFIIRRLVIQKVLNVKINVMRFSIRNVNRRRAVRIAVTFRSETFSKFL